MSECRELLEGLLDVAKQQLGFQAQQTKAVLDSYAAIDAHSRVVEAFQLEEMARARARWAKEDAAVLPSPPVQRGEGQDGGA